MEKMEKNQINLGIWGIQSMYHLKLDALFFLRYDSCTQRIPIRMSTNDKWKTTRENTSSRKKVKKTSKIVSWRFEITRKKLCSFSQREHETECNEKRCNDEEKCLCRTCLSLSCLYWSTWLCRSWLCWSDSRSVKSISHTLIMSLCISFIGSVGIKCTIDKRKSEKPHYVTIIHSSTRKGISSPHIRLEKFDFLSSREHIWITTIRRSPENIRRIFPDCRLIIRSWCPCRSTDRNHIRIFLFITIGDENSWCCIFPVVKESCKLIPIFYRWPHKTLITAILWENRIRITWDRCIFTEWSTRGTYCRSIRCCIESHITSLSKSKWCCKKGGNNEEGGSLTHEWKSKEINFSGILIEWSYLSKKTL